MGESELATLSATIEIMTAKTRAAFLDCREDPVPGPGPRRWWVLLCGGPLHPGDLTQRDAARAELRQHGVHAGPASVRGVVVRQRADPRCLPRQTAGHDVLAELLARGE